MLHVLYLIFNEGYTATSGAAQHRTDLSNEAIRLVREVHQLLPVKGDVAGLLALMLLTDARRAEDTDWPQILALYDMLMRITDNPMVALNRAIARAMVDGPDVELYREAAAKTTSLPERNYLMMKAARLSDGP